MLNELPEAFQALPTWYDVHVGPKRKFVFACKKCPKVWELDPTNARHLALAEHLASHASSHQAKASA